MPDPWDELHAEIRRKLPPERIDPLRRGIRAMEEARRPAADIVAAFSGSGLTPAEILSLIPRSREADYVHQTENGLEIVRTCIETNRPTGTSEISAPIRWIVRRADAGEQVCCFSGPTRSYDGEHYSDEGAETLEFCANGRAVRVVWNGGGEVVRALPGMPHDLVEELRKDHQRRPRLEVNDRGAIGEFLRTHLLDFELGQSVWDQGLEWIGARRGSIRGAAAVMVEGQAQGAPVTVAIFRRDALPAFPLDRDLIEAGCGEIEGTVVALREEWVACATGKAGTSELHSAAWAPFDR